MSSIIQDHKQPVQVKGEGLHLDLHKKLKENQICLGVAVI